MHELELISLLHVFFRCSFLFFRLDFLCAPMGRRGNMGGLIWEPTMTRRRQRKCRHCRQLYQPDPRNRRHQKYCSQPACRQASKAASQRRWRDSAKGRDYFRGPANPGAPGRVQVWRKANPGYWRRGPGGAPERAGALQDHCETQVIVPAIDTFILTPDALQDVILTQGFVLTGLIANLTDSTLQENIASVTGHLIRLGQQIQGPSSGRQSDGCHQTSVVSTAAAASTSAVQLGRSPPGSG